MSEWAADRTEDLLPGDPEPSLEMTDLPPEIGEEPGGPSRPPVSRNYIPRASAKNTDPQTQKTLEPLLPSSDNPPKTNQKKTPTSSDSLNTKGKHQYRAERQIPPEEGANGTAADSPASGENGRSKPGRPWVSSQDLDSPTHGMSRRVPEDIGARDPAVDIPPDVGPLRYSPPERKTTHIGHQPDDGIEMEYLNRTDAAPNFGLSLTSRPRDGDTDRMTPPAYDDAVRSKYVAPSVHSSEVALTSRGPVTLVNYVTANPGDIQMTSLPRSNEEDVTRMAASLSSTNQDNQETSGTGQNNVCHRFGGPFPVMWNWLRGACTSSVDQATRTKRRKIILSCSVIGCLLLLFLALFPVSWDQVEYHQIAFKRSRTTQKVDSDQTYYPGCYIVGPDSEFVYLPGTAHTLALPSLHVTTRDRLEVTLGMTMQYFIRPEEAGLLFEMFEFEYTDVLKKIAVSTIKNEIIRFSLDDMRLNRTGVEKALHKVVYDKLSGDCCPVCCPTFCSDLCSRCKINILCSPGFHVNVKYFWLGALSFTSQIEDRLMRRLLLLEEAEAEKFKQESTVTEKMTDLQVQAILNEANEILQFANAKSIKLEVAAVASAEKVTQNASMVGWQQTCDRLGLTVEDHKMSMLYIRTLNAMDNLYRAEDFDVNYMWHYPQSP